MAHLERVCVSLNKSVSECIERDTVETLKIWTCFFCMSSGSSFKDVDFIEL